MKSIRALTLLATVLFPTLGHSAAYIYDQFTIVNTGSNVYYDIGASTANPDFDGAVLGTLNPGGGGSLTLGGEGKSDKDNGTDVTGMSLFYRIYSGAPSGTFTEIVYGFQTDFGGGNQQWGTSSNTGNLISGLLNGSYTLEVYSQIGTNGFNSANPVYNTNSGNNFKATFTITPEPSRASFALLGLMGLVLRRRRK